MRVCPTHYTMRTYSLQSWVVEGSLDFTDWTEMDRKIDNNDFDAFRYPIASFAVSNSAECRFIRLTQTGKNHHGDDGLVICAFEIFGTLLDRRE
jgi:hypothetical protein